MKRIILDGEVVGPWVRQKAGGRHAVGNPGIAVVEDGKLLVGVTYDDFTGTNIAIHSRCDDRGAPTREFYWMIFDYPFNRLGVNRITGFVSSSNKEAREVDEHLGFKEEAVLPGYFPDGDGIVYVMWRSECRWLALGKKYSKKYAPPRMQP